jgi:hypothetical protein
VLAPPHAAVYTCLRRVLLACSLRYVRPPRPRAIGGGGGGGARVLGVNTKGIAQGMYNNVSLQ